MSFRSKVRDVLQGKDTLGKTFWLWWWLPHVTFVVLGIVLVSFVATAPTRAAFYVALAILVAFVVAGFTQWVMFGVAVWKSAEKARTKGWGIVARGVLVLQVIGSLRVLQAFGSEEEQIDKIKSIVSAEQSHLPMKIDNYSTLTKITYQDYRLDYRFTTSPGALDLNRFRRGVLKPSCDLYEAAPGSTLRDVTYTIEAGGQTLGVIEIHKSDCSKT